MNVETGFDLTNYNGLKIAANAKRLAAVTSLEQLKEILGTIDSSEPVHILGAGTNTVWGASFINKTVLKMEIPSFEVLDEDKESVLVKIGAGENWDGCVARSVALDLSGIEALSGIPGTVGAGPIQNIGAYGQEIGQCLETVTIFDRNINQTKILDKSACRLTYRDSIFKHEAKKLIITNIILRLSKRESSVPNYPDVIAHFENRKIPSPNLQEIREAVLGIRAKKLPDPKVIPNCGSFFKNPIVGLDKALELKEKFPDMPQYPFENKTKIPAGWLIDSLGMKGQRFGGIEIYKNNALVLTAPESNAVIEDVLTARDQIIKQVVSVFGITLEIEPMIVT